MQVGFELTVKYSDFRYIQGLKYRKRHAATIMSCFPSGRMIEALGLVGYFADIFFLLLTWQGLPTFEVAGETPPIANGVRD